MDLNGVFVRTDRTQFERSTEYAEGVRDNAHLQTTNVNPLDILTDNYALGAKFKTEAFGGETTFKLGYAAVDDDEYEYEDETTFDDDDHPFPDDDVFESGRTKTRIRTRSSPALCSTGWRWARWRSWRLASSSWTSTATPGSSRRRPRSRSTIRPPRARRSRAPMIRTRPSPAA